MTDLKIIAMASALTLSFAAPASAGNYPGPALGQIVNWNSFRPPSADFVSSSGEWTKSNLEMTFHKLYDNTRIHCDVMVDALTPTNNRVSIGLFTDDDTSGVEQSLAGAPNNEITFAYSFDSYRVTHAGYHNLYIYTAVSDGKPVTFVSRYALITCFERARPPITN